MLGINETFCKTKLYNDFKNDVLKSFTRNLKQGHILLRGNYSTLLGNGLELLKMAVGEFFGKSEIGVGNVHSHKFAYGKTLLASRSPHITMGNILLAENVAHDEIDEYFNLSNEIVYINAIGENIQQRLNGCDYDSDTMLLTDDETLVSAARKHYGDFKVPTCFVSAKKTERRYNATHQADLDIKTSANKIGEIVNLSQQLNSLFWEQVNTGTPLAECMGLYYDICKLAALSGLEIDRAKKEFVVSSGDEISYLKEKYKIKDDGQTIKPMFFKMITLENGYKLSPAIKYKYFHTSMDYIQKAIASNSRRRGVKYKQSFLPFMSLVKKPEGLKLQGYYYSKKDRIVDLVRTAQEDIRKLYIDYESKSKEEKYAILLSANERKQECIDTIDKIFALDEVMYLTLKELDSAESADVAKFMFETLFGKPDEAFFRLIRESKQPIDELVEVANGDIKIYEFTFEKRLSGGGVSNKV